MLSRAVTAASLFAAVLLLGINAAPAFHVGPYLHPQQLVDIGGRRLNLYCTGSGSPTVILDTDQDSSTVEWRFVQPAVAKFTRVCSYDAAGLGFSDPAPAPRDAAAYARDLHTLVKRARISAPYVLVGYSFSALPDRLYANEYRHDVAGMVFVDPLIPFRNDRLAALVPALRPLTDEQPVIEMANFCKHAAMRKKLAPGTAAFRTCMWPTGPTDPALPQSVQVVLQQQWRRPGAWDDLLFDAQADRQSSAEVQRAHADYGNMPLIVLTSDVRADLQGAPLTNAQFTKIARAYEGWQHRIARLSTVGTQFVISGSTASSMPVQHVSTVVSAIGEVVQQTRSKRR